MEYPKSVQVHAARGSKVFFCSEREKCIYALTGQPLFETKTGVLQSVLYRIGLRVPNRIPTKTLSLLLIEVTRAL